MAVYQQVLDMSAGGDHDFAKVPGATLAETFETLSERLLAVPNPFLAPENATADEGTGRP